MNDAEVVVEEIEIPVHARMLPRAVLDAPSDRGRRNRKLVDDLEILDMPGVYVLYRDDIPYYIGQANRLIHRLKDHHKPGARYGLFWNYFSVFVLKEQDERNRIEAILITAFPTSNGATPRIKRQPYPKEVTRLVRKMRATQIGLTLDDDNGTEE